MQSAKIIAMVRICQSDASKNQGQGDVRVFRFRINVRVFRFRITFTRAWKRVFGFSKSMQKSPNLITLSLWTYAHRHLPLFCFACGGGRESESEREGEATILCTLLILLASSFININGGVNWDLWEAEAEAEAEAELSIRLWWKLRTIPEPHHCLNYQRERERWVRDIWEATIHMLLANTVKSYTQPFFTLRLYQCMHTQAASIRFLYFTVSPLHNLQLQSKPQGSHQMPTRFTMHVYMFEIEINYTVAWPGLFFILI